MTFATAARMIAAAFFAGIVAFTADATAQQRAPIDMFIGYDSFRSPDLSPNGRYVAAVRREAIGDVLVVVDLQTQAVTPIQVARAEHQMEIYFVEFKSDDRLVFGVRQKIHVVPTRNTIRHTQNVDDGFQWVSRVYSSNIDGSGALPLYDPSSQQGLPRHVSAGIVSMLPGDDNHVLLIVPDQGGSELWRVNITTGDNEVVERGYINTFNYIVDVDGVPVLRQDVIAGGRGYAWLRRGRGENNWTEVVRFRGASGANSGPTFQGVGAALQPGRVFVLARRDGDDTSGLYIFDANTGQYVETVQTNPDFDVSNAIRDIDNNTILAACWWAYQWTCEPKDAAFAAQWNGIRAALNDELNVRLLARGGENNTRWLVQTDGPQDLGTFYLYDGQQRTLQPLFGSRPEIDPALLPTQRVIHYTASDGMDLWGYLWLPPGVTDASNLPTIVVPHGGPEGRDVWGFDPFATTLASQGYAVFQPNFRGGGGFGRAFVEAGHRQWGQRMQEDVADGARHLVAQGITDPQRMCIMGWSYGGYVAFTASFLNTDVFRCSVAGAGVSDLGAMLRWVRSGSQRQDVVQGGGGQGSQSVSYQYWTDAIGEPGRDTATMNAYSAAQNADRVTIPLLIIHGEEDETVPIEQSELMVRAMRRAGKDARMVELVDTDHYFTADQGEAWRTVMTESLAFFNQHIGPGVPPSQ